MSEKSTNRDIAQRILKRLRLFNRKERDHLMKFALYDERRNSDISQPLWRLVSGNQGLRRPKPDLMFIGMDYHLNWLFAALRSSLVIDDDALRAELFENDWRLDERHKKKIAGKKTKKGELKDLVPIQGNQEDVDLLSAWIRNDDESPLCITLIEAKLDSQWTTEQLDSKMQRIALIQTAACSPSLALNWIEWRCLLLSPTSTIKDDSREVETYMQEEYPKMLRKFCTKSEPMQWKWWHWDGLSTRGGRLSVNRVKGNHSKWRVTSV